MLARLISSGMHAVMDYAMGLLLVASPWLFGFADESSAATWIAVISGIALLGLTAFTDHEGGFIRRAIALRTHLMMDAALGLFLAVSPWLFGFADQGTNAWLPFVLIGLGEIGAAALTDPDPRESRAGSRAQTA
jgi:SPW repeat